MILKEQVNFIILGSTVVIKVITKKKSYTCLEVIIWIEFWQNHCDSAFFHHDGCFWPSSPNNYIHLNLYL